MEFDGTEYNKEHFESVKPCAWCLKEQNIPPRAGDSHGICDKHYADEMAKMSDNHKQILIQDIETALEQFEEDTDKQIKSISFKRVRTGLKSPHKIIEYVVNAEVVE